MPLYVSLFHCKTLPKPTMLAAGRTPLLISPPPPPPGGAAAAPAGGPPTALQAAAVRQVRPRARPAHPHESASCAQACFVQHGAWCPMTS
jgi:hypothetical protein